MRERERERVEVGWAIHISGGETREKMNKHKKKKKENEFFKEKTWEYARLSAPVSSFRQQQNQTNQNKIK